MNSSPSTSTGHRPSDLTPAGGLYRRWIVLLSRQEKQTRRAATVREPMTNDRRVRDQARYLKGARLRRATYEAPSKTRDHDPCELCDAKFMAREGVDVLREGWQTEDEFRWVCGPCFDDSRGPLGFEVIADGSPARCVEFHDARIRDIDCFQSRVTVSLHAFVHDDADGDALSGCWQRIDLLFSGAQLDAADSGEGWVLEGSLQVGDDLLENELPIPCRRTGALTMRLSGAALSVVVRASSVWLVVRGPPERREERPS